VPEVLLSGHHARIAEWRLAQSRARAVLAGGTMTGDDPESPGT
jgi:tRNA G37 N-methylase TrmD